MTENSVGKIKNSLESLTSRVATAEDRVISFKLRFRKSQDRRRSWGGESKNKRISDKIIRINYERKFESFRCPRTRKISPISTIKDIIQLLLRSPELNNVCIGGSKDNLEKRFK